MTGWVCQWKPFWIPVDDSLKKADVEDWVFQVTDTFELPFLEVSGILFLCLLRCRCLSHRHHGKHRNPRFQLVLRNTLRHHCHLCSHHLHVIVCTYLSLVMLFFQATRIFTCQGSDQFIVWGKRTPDEILTEHVVDIHRIEADFRDAFERNQASSSQRVASTNTFLLNHPCRRGSAFTTGTLGPDEVRKVLSRNKLQESGTSLPYKKLLTKSNTKSFTNVGHLLS